MLTSELLSIIDQYVEGAISLERLEDWLVPRLPVLFRLPLSEPEAADLAAAVELGLAEISDQTRTEEQFRQMLRRLLEQINSLAIVYPGDAITVTGSSNQTLSMPAVEPDPAEFVISRA